MIVFARCRTSSSVRFSTVCAMLRRLLCGPIAPIALAPLQVTGSTCYSQSSHNKAANEIKNFLPLDSPASIIISFIRITGPQETRSGTPRSAAALAGAASLLSAFACCQSALVNEWGVEVATLLRPATHNLRLASGWTSQLGFATDLVEAGRPLSQYCPSEACPRFSDLTRRWKAGARLAHGHE